MLEHVEEFERILQELHDSGALKHLVLIGSWTVHVYEQKYPDIHSEQLTTQDVDFSVHGGFKKPRSAKPTIRETLKRLGYDSFPKGGPPPGQVFRADIEHSENQMHIEFLCAQGRMKKPFLVAGLEVVATPLEYHEYLLDHTEVIDYKGIPVIVPLREYFAAHKISISQRRPDPDKGKKDLLCAMYVMESVGKEKVLEIGTERNTRFHKRFIAGWKQLGHEIG